MYNPYDAAKYIFYRLKLNSKSKFVNPNNIDDLVISYNHGIGNLGKIKKKIQPIPKESKDYIKTMKTIKEKIKDPFNLET